MCKVNKLGLESQISADTSSSWSMSSAEHSLVNRCLQILRQYLDSDWKRFPGNILDAVSRANYPFCSAEQRLLVLGWLANRFLQSTAYRQELRAEGKVVHDEHCRDCGKAGELICCDGVGCPAAYHLRCLDPPMTQVPAANEPWFCCICKLHQVPIARH